MKEIFGRGPYGGIEYQLLKREAAERGPYAVVRVESPIVVEERRRFDRPGIAITPLKGPRWPEAPLMTEGEVEDLAAEGRISPELAAVAKGILTSGLAVGVYIEGKDE